MKRLLPPALVAILLAAMMLLNYLVPGLSIIDGRPRVVGAVVAVAGAAITIVGNRQFAKAETNIMTFDDPDRLVETGLFSVTRNPMYLGFSLLLAGVAFGLGTISPWIGPAVFVVAADRWYIPFEEQRMLHVFGDDYVRYKTRVARWIGPSSSAVKRGLDRVD